MVLWKVQIGRADSSWVTHSSVLASDMVNTVDFQDGQTTSPSEPYYADGQEPSSWALELVLNCGSLVKIGMLSSGTASGKGELEPRALALIDRSYPSPTTVCISPSASHVAWYTDVSFA